MIVRFSSTVEQVVGTEPSFWLLVRPIAGFEILEVDEGTRLLRADGSTARWSELNPGSRIAVCGEDNGTDCLLAHELIVHPMPTLVTGAGAMLTPERPRRRLIPFFGLNLIG